MTALSITYPATESLANREGREVMRCPYCGEPLGFLRRRAGKQFCADEHRRIWHYERLARALQE